MNLLRVGKVEALKIYRYRNRYRGKSLFTYRLLTELRIPLPYISAPHQLSLPVVPPQVTDPVELVTIGLMAAGLMAV